MCSKKEDVQYESGISSARMRMCSLTKVDHQVLVQGTLLKDTFQLMNHYSYDVLFTDILSKTISSLWQAAKLKSIN